jgi:hypothetical protein
MDQQRHFYEADTARWAETAKTPDTLLGSSVNALIRLTQVASSANLGPVWWALAPESKAQQRNVLQRAVDEAMAIRVPGGTRMHIDLNLGFSDDKPK